MARVFVAVRPVPGADRAKVPKFTKDWWLFVQVEGQDKNVRTSLQNTSRKAYGRGRGMPRGL